MRWRWCVGNQLNKVIAGALYIVICGWNAVKVLGWQLTVKWFTHTHCRTCSEAAHSKLCKCHCIFMPQQLTMMMSGFEECIINSPQTRYLSAKRVGLQMSRTSEGRELQYAEWLVNCSWWLGVQLQNSSSPARSLSLVQISTRCELFYLDAAQPSGFVFLSRRRW